MFSTHSLSHQPAVGENVVLLVLSIPALINFPHQVPITAEWIVTFLGLNLFCDGEGEVDDVEDYETVLWFIRDFIIPLDFF